MLHAELRPGCEQSVYNETKQRVSDRLAPKATYLFLIEHVIISDDVLNLIDSIVRLVFCKGTLLFEQGHVERNRAGILLMQNLQIVATKKKKFF